MMKQDVDTKFRHEVSLLACEPIQISPGRPKRSRHECNFKFDEVQLGDPSRACFSLYEEHNSKLLQNTTRNVVFRPSTTKDSAFKRRLHWQRRAGERWFGRPVGMFVVRVRDVVGDCAMPGLNVNPSRCVLSFEWKKLFDQLFGERKLYTAALPSIPVGCSVSHSRQGHQTRYKLLHHSINHRSRVARHQQATRKTSTTQSYSHAAPTRSYQLPQGQAEYEGQLMQIEQELLLLERQNKERLRMAQQIPKSEELMPLVSQQPTIAILSRNVEQQRHDVRSGAPRDRNEQVSAIEGQASGNTAQGSGSSQYQQTQAPSLAEKGMSQPAKSHNR